MKIKDIFLARIKRLRQNEYHTQIKLLCEKFSTQNLNDLAKRGRCNIFIWLQTKKAQNPKLLVRSDSNYSDDINLITKNKSHPYSPLQYQLKIEDLKAKIYHTQSQEIKEITIWEGFSKKLDKTKVHLKYETDVVSPLLLEQEISRSLQMRSLEEILQTLCKAHISA